MSARHLSPRTIRHALGVVRDLPARAQAELVERLIERFDGAVDTDQDVGAEDLPVMAWAKARTSGAGDALDAEPDENLEASEVRF